MAKKAKKKSVKKNEETLSKEVLDATVSFTEQWLNHFFPYSDLPGLSVAIRTGEGIAFKKAWGEADIEKHRKLSTRDMFRVASQSKMFTATAIGLLVDHGMLKFDDPIGKYLPELNDNDALKDITIRDLLAHKSKLPRDGHNSVYWSRKDAPFPSDEEFASQTENMKPVTAKLKGLKYSNWGYGLLGKVIEAVAEIPYSQFIHEFIITPMKLECTKPDGPFADEYRMAKGYSARKNGERTAFDPLISAGALSPAAGLCSTPSDMTEFLMLVLNPRFGIPQPKTLKELCSKFNKVPGEDGTSYGLGFERHRIGSHAILGHEGSFMGTNSSSAFSRRFNLAASVISNEDQANANYMLESIFRTLIFFNKYAAHLNADGAEQINGVYTAPHEDVHVVLLQDPKTKAKRLRVTSLNDEDPWEDTTTYAETQDNEFLIMEQDGSSHDGETVQFFDQAGLPYMKVAGTTFEKQVPRLSP